MLSYIGYFCAVYGSLLESSFQVFFLLFLCRVFVQEISMQVSRVWLFVLSCAFFFLSFSSWSVLLGVPVICTSTPLCECECVVFHLFDSTAEQTCVQ